MRWLENYEQQPGEESPLGLILCANKGIEQIELLQLDKGSIRVAAYLTELPRKWGPEMGSKWGHILISDYSFYIVLYQDVILIAEVV